MACRIVVPNPRIKPIPAARRVWSRNFQGGPTSCWMWSWISQGWLCRAPALPRETLGDGGQAGLELRTLAARVFSDDSGGPDAWSLGCCCWEIVGSPTGITGERSALAWSCSGSTPLLPSTEAPGHELPRDLPVRIFAFSVSCFCFFLPATRFNAFILYFRSILILEIIWSVLLVISL